MAHPTAQFIGVPTGVETMLVGITIGASGLRWFRHNFARFPVTRMHRTPGGGYNLLYKLPLPPVPILQCSQGRLARGIDVLGEGGSIIWPSPAPYQRVTPECIVALEAPIGELPRWIIDTVTAGPPRKGPPVLQLPRRGIDIIRQRLTAYVKYSRQGTRVEVTFAAGRAAGRLVAQRMIGEREAVQLVAGVAVEGGLTPGEALAAARHGVKVGEVEQGKNPELKSDSQ
jgi:Bifunctional DNA primase/polymerase, N-terminal